WLGTITACWGPSHPRQGLLKVPAKVLRVLQADKEPDKPHREVAGLQPPPFPVRLDRPDGQDQAFKATPTHPDAKERQGVDKPPHAVQVRVEFKAEKASHPPHLPPGELVLRVALEPGVDHPPHFGMLFEPRRDLKAARFVLAEPQGKRAHAPDAEPCLKGAAVPSGTGCRIQEIASPSRTRLAACRNWCSRCPHTMPTSCTPA